MRSLRRRGPLLAVVVALFSAGWLLSPGAVAGAGAASGAVAGADATHGRSATNDIVLLDDFEDATRWTPHPADGVELSIRSDSGLHGRSLRLDFRFASGGGYAIARRALDLDLPENYAFGFRIRGKSPPNHLEFKLIDSTDENVWWSVRRNFEFPREWSPFSIKKRQIQFAWGPAGGGEIRHVAALEIVVTAGSGGSGTVWLDDLTLRELPPPDAHPPAPVATASSSDRGTTPFFVLDGDPTTAWRPKPGDKDPWIVLDLGMQREYGGLVLEWSPSTAVTAYSIEAPAIGIDAESESDASKVPKKTTWRTLRTVRDGDGGRDYLFLPESEARWIRVHLKPVNGPRSKPPRNARSNLASDAPSLSEVCVEPLSWSATRESFFQAIAKEARRGLYPRAIFGEQSYWTVIGVDADPREGLMNEDGMLETGRGAFSVEPFLYAEGKLLTWSDVSRTLSLEDRCLPIPSVEWRADSLSAPLRLTVTAFGSGEPGASFLVARYRVENASDHESRCTLFLAMRPFQVNPPAQFLNLAGGTAPIRSLESAGSTAEGSTAGGSTVRVNGERAIVSLTPPDGFGAAPFDGGDIAADYLSRGTLPPASETADSFAAASGAWAYHLDLPAGAQKEVDLVIPLYFPAADSTKGPAASAPNPHTAFANVPGDQAASWTAATLEASRMEWRAKTSLVTIELPDTASWVTRIVRSQLAYILINRAGPAIQPGTRSYARSWIRDGSLTSSALLRLGHPEVVRDFMEWYAPHQYASGKIPCVVDARGADPVPEHDSSGEFIFLVAEYDRYARARAQDSRTGSRPSEAAMRADSSLLTEMVPRALHAARYLDSLRQERRTPEYRTPEKEEFFGLLPPSISHEGYSAKPMHSYWDDLFALRGFRDAAYLAGRTGLENERAHWTAVAEEFGGDLGRSVEAAMRRHGIDYIPGCADLGDFDATSTTIALSPVGAESVLPAAALRRTFERYYEFFTARRNGAPWDAFTPYEIRNLGAFAHLGWRARARELLDFFHAYERPAAWNQWPEVVWHEEREPHFLGDLPHTWVGSDFVRAVLDLFAFVREEDGALVLGAGLPEEWLYPGLALRAAPTPYGRLDFSVVADSPLGEAADHASDHASNHAAGTTGVPPGQRGERRVLRVAIGGGLKLPASGIVLTSPIEQAPARITVDGRRRAPSADGTVVIHSVPAEVILEY